MDISYDRTLERPQNRGQKTAVGTVAPSPVLVHAFGFHRALGLALLNPSPSLASRGFHRVLLFSHKKMFFPRSRLEEKPHRSYYLNPWVTQLIGLRGYLLLLTIYQRVTAVYYRTTFFFLTVSKCCRLTSVDLVFVFVFDFFLSSFFFFSLPLYPPRTFYLVATGPHFASAIC